jgi:hypothetical protein
MEVTQVEKEKSASHEVQGPSMDEWDPWNPPYPPCRPLPPGLDVDSYSKLVKEVR